MKLLAKLIILVVVFYAGFYLGGQEVTAPDSLDNQPASQEQAADSITTSLMLDFGNGVDHARLCGGYGGRAQEDVLCGGARRADGLQRFSAQGLRRAPARLPAHEVRTSTPPTPHRASRQYVGGQYDGRAKRRTGQGQEPGTFEHRG